MANTCLTLQAPSLKKFLITIAYLTIFGFHMLFGCILAAKIDNGGTPTWVEFVAIGVVFVMITFVTQAKNNSFSYTTKVLAAAIFVSPLPWIITKALQ